MSQDAKMDFYLRNRELIEEWAALRGPAAALLHEALFTSAGLLPAGGDVPEPVLRRDGRPNGVALAFTTDPFPVVTLELAWEAKALLSGAGGGWPVLAVSMDPAEPKSVRNAVRAAVAPAKDSHAMPSSSQWWLRYGPVAPPSEPVDVTAYAQYCVERLRAAFVDLAAPVRSAVREHAPAG